MELAAVIVETRPLVNLKRVIEDHLKYLPENTRLYVFGSNEVDLLLSQAEFNFKFINIGSSMSIWGYNLLLTSKHFWETIQEENILIFQHDSEILRKGIEDFFQYDYVGAPWKFKYSGGNGGLSFRKRSAMIHVVENFECKEGVNEDVFFSNCLIACGKNIAPRKICSEFSCETIFNTGTFGAHAIDKWLTKQEYEIIRNQYK